MSSCISITWFNSSLLGGCVLAGLILKSKGLFFLMCSRNVKLIHLKIRFFRENPDQPQENMIYFYAFVSICETVGYLGTLLFCCFVGLFICHSPWILNSMTQRPADWWSFISERSSSAEKGRCLVSGRGNRDITGAYQREQSQQGQARMSESRVSLQSEP